MTCAACCPEAPRALRLAYPCADAVPLYGGRWSGYLRPRTPLRSQVSGLSHVRVMLFAARLDGLHTRLLSKRIADTDNDGAVLDDIDELISDAVASSSVERIDTLSKVCLPFLTALLSFAIDDPSKGEHLDRISSLVSRLSSSQGAPVEGKSVGLMLIIVGQGDQERGRGRIRLGMSNFTMLTSATPTWGRRHGRAA